MITRKQYVKAVSEKYPLQLKRIQFHIAEKRRLEHEYLNGKISQGQFQNLALIIGKDTQYSKRAGKELLGGQSLRHIIHMIRESFAHLGEYKDPVLGAAMQGTESGDPTLADYASIIIHLGEMLDPILVQLEEDLRHQYEALCEKDKEKYVLWRDNQERTLESARYLMEEIIRTQWSLHQYIQGHDDALYDKANAGATNVLALGTQSARTALVVIASFLDAVTPFDLTGSLGLSKLAVGAANVYTGDKKLGAELRLMEQLAREAAHFPDQI